MIDMPQLEDDVRAALRRDPRIDDPDLIAVSADEIGTVVLRGAVPSPRQRRAAVHDARRVDGVFLAIDQLDVHPPVAHRRADDALRAAALRRLNSHPRVRAGHIHVAVSDGRVTLTGYVRDTSQRRRAADDVARLDGVAEVADRIEVRG